MKRIQLVLAALAIVVTSFAAFAGPVMAQLVYENTDNYSNQEGWENGYYVNPDYDDYCDYYPWDPYCWGYYDDDDDDTYWISPDAYYVGNPYENEPWAFYYEGEGDVSYNF